VIEFDPNKDEQNVAKHGVSLARFVDIDVDSAIFARSAHLQEERYVVVGRIDGRLHVGVITYRGERVRVISLRKANRRELRKYEKTTGS
jgi:uncharacterized DUF497 family protein